MQNTGSIFKNKPIPEIQDMVLKDMKLYFEKQLFKNMPSGFFNIYSPIRPEDPDRKHFTKIFNHMIKEQKLDPSILNLSPKQSRGIASILGMAICDALGACTQFEEYNPNGWNFIQTGFTDIPKRIQQKKLKPRSGQTTIWTDDASMGFVMAYSLLLKNYKFDPVHMRYMFQLWWSHGLGNGGRKHSIGLGGNISISIQEFFNKQTQFAQKGKQNNSGNGSLMRLAPIPVAFSGNPEQAMRLSELSSLTTHNGLEAKECCRLMAAIIVALINREDDQKLGNNEGKNSKSEELPKWKQVIEKVCNEFKSDIASVMYLAQSKQEPEDFYEEQMKNSKAFKIFNTELSDRNWNWKDKDFRYSKTRNMQQPGYIGSYCMDALAMALHTVWSTNSFKECALKNTNLGGDCDSVGSVAGQIAGAVYGVDERMLALYSEMEDFTTKRYEAFLVGYKMITYAMKSEGKKGPIKESNKMEIQEQC